MTLFELEQAVIQLSNRDLAHFRDWLDEYCAQLWEQQIETDAKAGRLDKIMAEATQEPQAELSKPL